MKRIGIIGIGNNAKYYKDGFNNASFLDLVAVCDINKNPASFSAYKSYVYYDDYEKMIKIEMLDFVLIATEPSKHYEIAKRCLELGINVLIEGPAGLSYMEVASLINYARNNSLLFDVINHTDNYDEVKYLKERFNEFGSLKDIYITVNRPYCSNGKNIDNTYNTLNGAYFYDSYEVYDLLSNFLPLKKVMLIEKKTKKDSLTKADVYDDYNVYIDGVNVHLVFDWTSNSSLINTKFVFNKHVVNVCHSSQIITINVREQINCKSTTERLSLYYKNYLTTYEGKVDYDHILNVHKILFNMKEL